MQEIFALQKKRRQQGKRKHTHIDTYNPHLHMCFLCVRGRFLKSFFMLVCIHTDFYADLSLFNRRNNTPTQREKRRERKEAKDCVSCCVGEKSLRG